MNKIGVLLLSPLLQLYFVLDFLKQTHHLCRGMSFLMPSSEKRMHYLLQRLNALLMKHFKMSSVLDGETSYYQLTCHPPIVFFEPLLLHFNVLGAHWSRDEDRIHTAKTVNSFFLYSFFHGVMGSFVRDVRVINYISVS